MRALEPDGDRMNFESNSAALVRTASFTDEARWNGYVDQHPDACVYHRFAWGKIFNRVYGVKSYPLVAERDGRVAGLLPLVELTRGPLRPQIVSLPYFAHGGAIADDEAAYRALLTAATRMESPVRFRHATTKSSW
jgi:hypothetical protein